MKHLSKVYSAELLGIDATLIEVEVDINVGLHSFSIVGLADKATNEAKERVSSALKNSGTKPPNRENRKITVNLAPADIKKTGSQYDLAIAIGYLLATEQLKEFDTSNKMFVGELSLDGGLRPISGALNIARMAKRHGFKFLFLPKQNARQAAIIDGIQIIPVENIETLMLQLEDKAPVEVQTVTEFIPSYNEAIVDVGDIKGQENAKRALIVAASGGHHMIMSGAPGGGKTMLAQALISILPPPTLHEAIEVNQIYGAAGLLKDGEFLSSRPFRAPHHTASPISIVGGGTNPKPGEISLAHRGILFLDEIPEFRRDLLEALRQPIESGTVNVSRVKNTISFPAKFSLVAAMNPCPCGYFGDPEKECRCTANEVFRYQKKISGPLLDRIDIQIEVPRVKIDELRSAGKSAEGDAVRRAVQKARGIQEERFKKVNMGILLNSEMSSKQVDVLVRLDQGAEKFLKSVLDKAFLSARGYYRVLKIGRTIADLDGREQVSDDHLGEAFQYRVREAVM